LAKLSWLAFFRRNFKYLQVRGSELGDNVDVGSKYQFLVSAEHEAILSVGVDAEIGGTGLFAAFATRNCSTVFE
jgi:hypothetical protein